MTGLSWAVFYAAAIGAILLLGRAAKLKGEN
jgi:hypothetical protein